MNYDTAKAIVAEHAPSLLLDPETIDPHIVVRKAEGGEPFSIHLPHSIDKDATPEERAASEFKLLTDALDAAANYLSR